MVLYRWKAAREACLAAALVVVGASPVDGAASVDSVSAFGGALFEMMDSSDDGSVSRLEAYSAGVQIVSSLDQNWDGHLSLSEVSTIPRRFAPRSTSEERQQLVDYMRLAFPHLDLDGDNWVSRHEFLWWNGVIFSTVDADRDGLVTWVELEPVLRHLTGVGSAAH